MTATEQYVRGLERLKNGELSLLRTHAGRGLDETLHGFDVFTGLWWPIRQTNPRVPRREVAWLIAKLYAFRLLEHAPDYTLARGLRRCRPRGGDALERFEKRLDGLLTLSLTKIEPALRWALNELAEANLKLDWVRLTDELSIWERESTRLAWAEQYLGTDE